MIAPNPLPKPPSDPSYTWDDEGVTNPEVPHLVLVVVISDWVMPGMNGPEFCHAFRQLDRVGYGYFILLTSKGESREVAEGLNSGADDFLTKPFIFGELQARLRAGERIVEMHAQLIQPVRSAPPATILGA